jgi:hypothetical protein
MLTKFYTPQLVGRSSLRQLLPLFLGILSFTLSAQYTGGSADGFDSEEVNFLGLDLPLPLDLIVFTAEADKDVVALDWVTQNEVGTDYFGVERSLNGEPFVTVGTVAAAGTSAPDDQLSYSYTDYTAPEGSILYRLKMADLDGAFTYSPVRQVRLEATTEPTVGLFPNPSRGDQFNIRVQGIDAGTEVEVDVIDQMGRRITGGTLVVQPGAAINFPLQRQLPNGAYTVRVTNPTLGTISQKLSVN